MFYQPEIQSSTVNRLNDSPWVYWQYKGLSHIQTNTGFFICAVKTKEEAAEILAHHDMDLLINMPIEKRKYYVTNKK